ncbi:hypothetical protein [Pontibacter ruber]|uniref:Uncharacterized protein n=1 Tax=Pontibacter ruber TaxID=1343895 RepID=A0ABW5CXD0_9BACT|nr:hypothetical protein [Pontibacter ruber]
MNQVKSIATVLLLQLWAALLCFSVSFTPGQALPEAYNFNYLDATEELKQQEQGTPVAWAEPTAPYAAAAVPELEAPLLLLACGLLLSILFYQALKPTKAILGFSSLSEQYRILPNAP